MKKLHQITASILLLILLTGCISASADWSYTDDFYACEAYSADDQPTPMPIESLYDDPGILPTPLEAGYGEAEGTIPVPAQQIQEEKPLHSSPEPRYSAPAKAVSDPRIIGTPIVVANDFTQDSMFWTYLRTSKDCDSVAISYINGKNVENAKVFGTEYVEKYNADGTIDWCLPFSYSPTGTEEDHSRTALLRVSADGGRTWGDAVESNRFVVTPLPECPDALTDEEFQRMITEAERYLGFKYVWGGSSPNSSFDCSGFVYWVINHCDNGWEMQRSSADDLMKKCTIIRNSEAKPGDLIFFEKTYEKEGATHVGIYVGDGMMLHCGNPVQYESIEKKYWQDHFLCFGRLP